MWLKKLKDLCKSQNLLLYISGGDSVYLTYHVGSVSWGVLEDAEIQKSDYYAILRLLNLDSEE